MKYLMSNNIEKANNNFSSGMLFLQEQPLIVKN